MRFTSLPCRMTLTAAFIFGTGLFAGAEPPTTAPSHQALDDNVSAELQVGEAELSSARQRFEIVSADLRALQERMRTGSGRFDVSADALESDASRYDKELESLQLESVGAKARRDAIEKAIKEQSDQAKAALHDDPVAAELQKVVDARQEQEKFVAMQTKAGVATQADLTSAQATLAEAEAKLAERKRDAAAAAGAENLAPLNRELASLTIAEDEREAKIEFLKARLDKLRPLLEMTDDLQDRERDVAMVREEYYKAQQQAEIDRMQAQRDQIIGRLRAQRAQPTPAPSTPAAEGH